MDYLAIIERIEARLKEIKMGKMEFYKAIEISPNSFSLWKKGDTKPTNENLEKVATILGCDLEYLMFGEKEKAPTLSGEGSKIDDIYIKLNGQNRSALLALAETLLRGQE